MNGLTPWRGSSRIVAGARGEPHSFHSFSQFQIRKVTSFANRNPTWCATTQTYSTEDLLMAHNYMPILPNITALFMRREKWSVQAPECPRIDANAIGHPLVWASRGAETRPRASETQNRHSLIYMGL